ncbi:hypothetical protein [Thermococcus sp.]|uniref:hypothetical protein n=1 Tax=Thermococcus sp. TaxID=35749 RepID=UPI00262751F3|nr:hypothetical protein [Thermococcus sp.]
MISPGIDASPEELEELGFKYIDDGKVKDGLKLILRAAKGYEEKGDKENAARLYRYLGYFLAKRAGIEKARPSLLKSAYLYIDLIEEEISRPEVDIDRLDEYCFSVLEIFATLNDTRLLNKYALEFAGIYEDLGNSYEEVNDVSLAIRAYESAFRYYRLSGSEEEAKKIAEKLITLYGQIAESKLSEGDAGAAADAFYELARYTRAIFGYDAHFTEMMDTAAKNYEKASKLAYSEGDLDGTTSYLVKAQYAYLLAGNIGRAKLIGINTIRMLNQVVSSHRASGNDKMASEKLMEIAEALIGVGKVEEAMATYKSALELMSGLKPRARVRLAVAKVYAAQKKSAEVLEEVDIAEFHLKKNNLAKAFEVADKILEKRDELAEIRRKIQEAEGITEF